MSKRLLCVVALVVLWVAPSAYAQQRPVQAQDSSVAIGGPAIGNTINIEGVPYAKLEEAVRNATRPLEQLSSSQQEVILLLQEKLDLNQRQVRTALDIVGEANIPPERLAAKLVEVAERFKALQATAAAQPGDDPQVTALKAEAQTAINAGDLAKADELLAQVEQRQTAALDRLALNAAETNAQRGQVALTRLRYREAAQHFTTAAARVPGGHEDRRLAYLEQEADALYRQGDEFGDNTALRSAIERRRQILALRPRERMPLDWARTQMNLGNALWALGERESGTGRVEEAVGAFRAALQEWTRERVPLQWAGTQMNLGNALSTLGEREPGTGRLEEAVAAYRAALQEWTRERVPLQWAMTQMNLGTALSTLGEREPGTGRLEEAVAGYRAGLQERTPGPGAPGWAGAPKELRNAPS